MTIREEAFSGRPVSCCVIDAHTHMGPYHLYGWHQKYDCTDTGSVLKDMARLGIDCIVTAPHPMIQERMEEANCMAADLAKQYPGRVYGYISVVPACGIDAIRRELNLYSQYPAFLGVKFLPGYHGDLQQPEYEYAMDFANEMGCPVLCHEWYGTPALSEFAAALKTRHDMKLIIAHQGGGSAEHTRACIPAVREYENAYMELCGSLFNQLPVEQIVKMAGEDKVIFGTDAINLEPKYEFGKVAFSILEDRVKKKIFAENYLNLLKGSQMGKIS